MKMKEDPMRLALAAAMILSLPQIAMGQGLNVLHPVGSYTQIPTGMVFPESVGQFRRFNIIRYHPDGSDESAGYNEMTPMHEINMTVYIFPSPPILSFGSPRSVIDDTRIKFCQGQYETVQREVMGAHPDASPVEKREISRTQDGVTYAGHFASFDLTNAKFFGRTDVASRSEAYLYCYVGGKWSVEYRVDYPRDFDASSSIASFINDLAWSIPPEQK
jgi:hypothetical protein